MKYCTKCGQELEDSALYCTVCGATQNNDQANDQALRAKLDDGNSVGFNVLSFFFPIVGLVLFLVWKKEKPIRAKGCGIWALVGFIANIVLTICQIIALGVSA